MRFDDTFDTVLSTEPTTPAAAEAAWRQVVDLIGRGRVPAGERALGLLERIADDVTVGVRAASARALFGARPPAALVRLLALDDIAVAAPVLRSADLPAGVWIDLLPALSPTARAVLRHRRDLAPDVVRALASFGTVDFVIGGDIVSQTLDDTIVPPEPEPVPLAVDTSAFVSVGSVALGLPLVAEALRRENDNEPPPREDGAFRIADVVAKLEAFQRKRDGAISPNVSSLTSAATNFRFETDSAGTIRWIDGTNRSALIGISLAQPARPAEPGVDGVAAGAFRSRARFTDARLTVAGDGAAAGQWLLSAIPAFDRTSGRFTGFHGSGRRPRRHECAEPIAAAPASDALRQLVHELRTPTNAIAGFSEMIEHQMLGPVAVPHRGQAAVMRRDAGALLAAIDDLDAAARIDAGALELRPEPIALAPLLTRIAADLTPLLTQRGAQLDLPDGGGIAVADVRALERLIARMLGAMIGAAGLGETIAVRRFDGAGGRIGLAVTRPVALDAYPGEAILDIDDEGGSSSLLGIGFAMRLARNLAREQGGPLRIGHRTVTLYLPAAEYRAIGRVRAH